MASAMGGCPVRSCGAGRHRPGGSGPTGSRGPLADPRELRQAPLVFEENRGQAGPEVRYLSRGQDYGIFLTPDEARLAFRGPERQVRTLRLRWTGAGTGRPVPIAAEDRLAAEAHSLRGSDPARWHHTPLFSRVRYSGVYPGVDLVFYGRERQLEYDFVLAPGTDPETIRLIVEGAERLEVDSTGDLVLAFAEGEVRFRRPVSYQEVDGARREVASRYRRPSKDGTGWRVGFEVGAYDRTRPLLIDPVLVYSTYLGGREEDGAQAIAVDAAGNAYVTGYTVSFPDPPNDFPVTPNAFQKTGSWYDTFVTKLSPSGALVYSTLLGGEAEEGPGAILVDAAGHAYLVGSTASPDFPLVHPLQPGPKDYAPDAYIAKLSPDGSALLFSTTLGGSSGDFGADIAMDAQENLYVTGWTDSTDFPQPGFPPLPAGQRGSSDVFVVKLAPGGSALVYTRTVGGDFVQFGQSLAVDAAGQVYVTGTTGSAQFPVASAAQPSFGGGDYDAFVLKLDPAGSLIYSTYLGGVATDLGTSIAIDAAGNAYVTGETLSDDFPVAAALQPARRGARDAFVTRLSPTGSLVYSTYLGGTYDDQALDIAIDPAGSVYVTGATVSDDYPVFLPLQAGCAPNPPALVFKKADVFLTQLSAGGSSILFSTCLGGSGSEGGRTITLHPSGDLFVAGVTFSEDFPVLHAFQPTYGGGGDAFVTRIHLGRPPVCGTAAAHPALLWPPSGRFEPVALAGVTDPDGGPVTLRLTGIRQDEPLTGGEPDASGVGTATAQLRAARAGREDGRTYFLGFTATDEEGLSCSGVVTVCVPHDQRPDATCGNGGQLFDSTDAGR